MTPFTYSRPGTIEAALGLAGPRTAYLGGGVDLLGQLKDGISSPDALIALGGIPGGEPVRKEPQGWTLAFHATVRGLAEHADLARAFPGLAQAAAEVGSPQIRNVATLGGNLAQHVRCWYYRQPDVTCAKKGGATCYARAEGGENRYHALFSGGPCIAPVVSNLAIVLAALNATVNVRRGGQVLTWSVPQLYQKAWDAPRANNSLEPGDFIESVAIPSDARASAYRQVSDKARFDWALVSCAASVVIESGKVQQAGVYLGQVAPVPYANPAALEKTLVGRALNPAAASAAADALLAEAQPLAHNAYKIPLAKTLIRRALLACLEAS